MSSAIINEVQEGIYLPTALDENGLIPDDAKVSTLSLFGDSSWNFSIERGRPDVSRAYSTIHWHDTPRPIKEFIYLKMWRPLPGQKRINVVTALSYALALRTFWKWMKKAGIKNLEELTQDDFDAYLRSMNAPQLDKRDEDELGDAAQDDEVNAEAAEIDRENGERRLAPNTKAGRLKPLVSLPLFRGRGLSSSYSFIPWEGQSANDVVGWWPTKGSNLTPTIPDHVYRPLMATAIEDVMSFNLDDTPMTAGATTYPANDFRGCLSVEHEVQDGEHVTTVHVAPAPKPCTCVRNPSRKQINRSVLVDGFVDGKPSRLIINHSYWHCMSCDTAFYDRLDGLRANRATSWNALSYALKQAEAGRGYDAIAKQLTISPISLRKLIKLWQQRNNPSDQITNEATAYRKHIRRIVSACFIVIIGLSGMRDGEAKYLKAGCCEPVTDPQGNILHYRVRGRRLKQEKGDKRRQAKRENSVAVGTKMNYWVVVEEVAKAIRILEHIIGTINSSDERNEHHLFQRMDFIKGEGQASVITNLAMCKRMNAYMEDIFAERGLPAPEWKLTPMQFRETLAAHIAEEPFGTIAGQLQYGHVSQATFQGYCNSDSFWKGTIQKYEDLAKQEMAEEIVADVVEGHAYGGGAKRLRHYLGVAGDRRPNDIAYMVAHVAKTLHVGQFNYCFFSAESATCHRGAKVLDANRPILTHCDPHICGNSCVTRKHLPQWEAQIADAKSVLKTRGISPNQKAALLDDIADMDEVVTTVKKGKLHGV